MSSTDRRPKLSYSEALIPSVASPTGTGVPKSIEDLSAALQSKFGKELILGTVVGTAGDCSLTVQTDHILEVCSFLRDDERYLCQELRVISAVDYLAQSESDNAEVLGKPRIEIVYVLYSYVHKHQFLIKVAVGREGGQVPSLTPLWRCANWYERECYDLFGVIFTGHPDLKRILLPMDWVGHPLRKDYEFPEAYNGMKVPL